MTRDEFQERAAERLEQTGRLLCVWATGAGKSNVVLKFLKRHPKFRCLILVPEQNNIQNWYDEFDKFGVPRDNVIVSCYASFHKYDNTDWDLLVFDEMPHVDTQKRLAICNSVSGRYILALGAVIKEEERMSLENVYGRFACSYISLGMAMAAGILTSPTINVVHLGMTEKEKGDYLYYQTKVESAVKAHELSPTQYNRNRMLRAGNERKRFLGRLKDEAISLICQKLENKGKRFICFCASIKQAELIGKDHAFTSKTPASLKLLDRFNNGEINSLYVVGKLIEGQNLNNIECGVIGQLGGTQRITVQSIGRVMRSDNPVIYIPTFDGTKDDSFMYTLTSSIPERCIKHFKYNSIS